MKIFLVWEGHEYEIPFLEGVCSTKEKAEELVDLLKYDDEGNWKYQIEEIEVDARV